MSKIEELIQLLCPEGVLLTKLVDVANVQYGFPFDSNKFSDDETDIPLIRIRDILPSTPSTYYSGEYLQSYVIHKGDILVGMDGNFNLEKWKSRDGLLNQRVCRIYSKDSNVMLNGFLYHLLKPLFKRIEDEIKGGTVKHLSAAKINKIEIPFPPVEVQEEVVRILDKFTTLFEKLNEEQELRKKQYEYYREKILSFEGKNVELKSLGELFTFKNGLNKGKDFFGKGYPIVNFTDVYNNSSLVRKTLKGLVDVNDKEKELYNVKKGDVFFTRTSETQEDIGMASVMMDDIESCVFSGFVLRARPITDLLYPKYCAYCFTNYNIRKDIVRYSSFTTRALTSGSKLSKIVIPIPPLAEQKRIVSILDKFDTLINDQEKGLPAEIRKVQQQYEYYRDKLLTFKILSYEN